MPVALIGQGKDSPPLNRSNSPSFPLVRDADDAKSNGFCNVSPRAVGVCQMVVTYVDHSGCGGQKSNGSLPNFCKVYRMVAQIPAVMQPAQ